MKKIIVLACLLFPSVAFAQYYSRSSPTSQFPGGFHNRTGRLIFGGNIGLGGMSDRGGDIECNRCDYNPFSIQGAVHLGGFVGPRLALMGELQGNSQTLEADAIGETRLVQGALMFAAQYWVTPQLWIKGGIGFAKLQIEDQYFDEVDVYEPENGTALMGAVGFEILSARRFSVDLQGRLLNGAYRGIDNNVTALSVGIGVNWF